VKEKDKWTGRTKDPFALSIMAVKSRNEFSTVTQITKTKTHRNPETHQIGPFTKDRCYALEFRGRSFWRFPMPPNTSGALLQYLSMPPNFGVDNFGVFLPWRQRGRCL